MKYLYISIPQPGDGLSRGAIVLVCLFILFIGVGVRLLHWQNDWLTIDNNMWRLTAGYKEEAQFLIDGDIRSFVRGNTPQPDTGILMHAPGYPMLIALVYKVAGNSHTALRIFHVLCGAAAAVLLFLIAAKLLPAAAAIIAGLLVAVSPQLSFNSLLLLPDAIAIVPILLAIYWIVRARQRRRLTTIIAAGAAIGVSCWLRPNGLLLAPFLALLILLLFERGKRWTYAAAFVGAAAVVIAPITARNAIVYKSFIPISLGAGQNLTAGIADYDPGFRFGLEKYDDAACRQEARLYNRPDYADALYRPDGIERERLRRARALAVIRSNKSWFLGVMVQRAASMLEYEQVSIVSAEPSVSNRIEITGETKRLWVASPDELINNNKALGQAQLSLTADGQALQIKGDDSPQGPQLISAPISIQQKTDYVLRVPVHIEHGRMVVKVNRVDNGKTLGSATIPDSLTKESGPIVQIPFVSGSADQIHVVITNAQTDSMPPIMQIGVIELFELGPASYLWTRYPRMLIKSVQKFFTTRWLLPLTAFGVVLLVLSRRWSLLAIILAVPAYYLSVHSPLHVEPRYVLVMHYFFLMLVAVLLYWGGSNVWHLPRILKASKQSSVESSG